MDLPSSSSQNDELANLVLRAKKEQKPQAKAVLWGECICYVLSLEDIREDLTFEEILAMNDKEALHLADHMQAVFEMKRSWRDGIPDPNESSEKPNLHQPVASHKISVHEKLEVSGMASRKKWPDDVVQAIFMKCHMRCCVCPEHRRIADIHHIDRDSSNSVESNGVALCKQCHTDAHTTSTMQRNLEPNHLRQFKRNWELFCVKLGVSLVEHSLSLGNFYYMNAHRLDTVLQELGEVSITCGIPHHPKGATGSYDTLWDNPKNSLRWTQLLENRNYLECRLKDIIKKIRVIDLNLLEVGAVIPQEHLGGLVSFDCQFIGRDIPDQADLVSNCGQINGPNPTMRRELTDPSQDNIIETCMMLDMRYMYSDSSFIQFSADGIWAGIARLVNFRRSIGSHDGHMSRDQMILSPICIGNPAKSIRMLTFKSGNDDIDIQYLNLFKDQGINLEGVK